MEFIIQGHKTIQPLYICSNVDRIYFSKAGCIDVKILPPNFPQPMCKAANTHVSAIKTLLMKESHLQLDQSLFPLNQFLKISLLKQYILDSFASSTCNQSAPIPQMNTHPTKIHLKPNAVPYVRHSSIPIQHHWKAAVKKGLDQDVKKGITKQVDINTPVEWCSPMVISQKKD